MAHTQLFNRLPASSIDAIVKFAAVHGAKRSVGFSLSMANARTVKLTHTVTGKWECLASFDLQFGSESVIASTYRALRPLSGSASPRL